MNNRIERKWIIKNSKPEQLENILKNSNFYFFKSYEDRIVNSIYYDTDFLKFYYENLNGISKRKKIRFRWYGNKNPKELNFEIKKKSNFTSSKVVEKINLEKKINLNFSCDFLTKLKKFEIYKPITKVQYVRKYLISNVIPDIRATIDFDIRYQKIFNYKITQNKILDKNIILEFKYPVTIDNFVIKKIVGLNLRISKNSKYINSIRHNIL